MSDETATLPHLDLSDTKRLLVVVAHPDDAEYGTSCAVAAWTAAGIEVTYLLLTRGEAGIRTLSPAECGPLRSQEQIDGCAEVGVTDVRFLTFPDGQLEATLELRREIARVIREVRPDVVVTATWELEVAWGLNHADHRVCGLVTVDAIRDADNPWVHEELLAAGLGPWKAGRLLVSGTRNPTCGVDVTGEPLERGIASLEAHDVYLQALPDHPLPRPFLTEGTAGGGTALGVDHAVLFSEWPM